jgi:hypothetical protein
MNSDDYGWLGGFIIGVFLIITIWIACADFVEASKVQGGYLTFKHKIYKVELYDELKYPELPKKAAKNE